MIRIIFGGPGSGKTSYVSSLAVQAMTDPQIVRHDINNCGRLVRELNSGGWRLTVPQSHLVYADFFVLGRRRPRIVSYDVDGHKLGLPNEEYDTQFFPPFSRIFLDEAQSKLYSRGGGIDEYVSRFFELHRHNRFEITLVAQREKLIDINVREIVVEIIEVLGIRHKYDRFGRIKTTMWDCLVFDNCYEVQQYLASGKSFGGKRMSYSFNGNIFRHYDSFAFMPAFYAERYDRDFDAVPAEAPRLDITSMRAYNSAHPMFKPKK